MDTTNTLVLFEQLQSIQDTILTLQETLHGMTTNVITAVAFLAGITMVGLMVSVIKGRIR